MAIEVAKVELKNVSDASGLAACIEAGQFSADEVVAVIGKTEGNGGLSTDLSVADVRSDFTANLRNVLKSGAANLTLADPNEEGADQLALQTRTSLASASLSLTQRAESTILRLFT